MAAPRSGSSKGAGRARAATRKRSAVSETANPLRVPSRAGASEADAAPPARATSPKGRVPRTKGAAAAAGAAATATREASRRVLEATPAMVVKATSIIEEELAIGIGAVKRIEQRFLDVDALRAQAPDHVMSRFRKDAHEALDIIVDIVTAAAATVGERAGKVVNVTASHLAQRNGGASHPLHADSASTDAGATRLPTVRMPGTVAPGNSAMVMMSLENGSDTVTAEFTLHSSELVSASGGRIPARAVVFEPATLAVGPRAAGSVAVRVRVPPGAQPGGYEGLLRATQLEGLRAMLSVNVS